MLFAISTIGFSGVASCGAVLFICVIFWLFKRVRKAHAVEIRSKSIQGYRCAIDQMRNLKGDYLRTLDIVQVKLESGRFTYAELGTTAEEMRKIRERIVLVYDIRTIIDWLNRRDPQCLRRIAELHSMIASSGFSYEHFGLSAESIAALEREAVLCEANKRFEAVVRTAEKFDEAQQSFQELCVRYSLVRDDIGIDPDLKDRFSRIAPKIVVAQP